MATLYFYSSSYDSDWNNVNNWYYDNTFTMPASTLPTSSDDVYIYDNCTNNYSYSMPTVNSLVVDFGYNLGIELTVITSAIFNNGSYYSGPNLSANSVDFFNSSYNKGTIYVNLAASFHDSSINGDPSFMVYGYVVGACYFYHYSTCNNYGYIIGNPLDIVFYNSSVCAGVIYNINGGTIAFFDNAACDSYSSISHNGDITFSNSSYINGAAITADNFIFNDSTYVGWNNSTYAYIYGNAVFNDTSACLDGAMLYGNATFNDSSYIGGNGTAGNNYGDIVTFNDTSYNEGTVPYDAVFNDSSYNTAGGYVCYVGGFATFNDDSFNLGTIIYGTTVWDGFTGINSYNKFTGGEINPSQPATFYFNGAVGNDWDYLGSWWVDSGFSIPAPFLPSSMDDVIISSTISSNMGSEPTVNNLTTTSNISIYITVTGLARFNNAYYESANLTGNAIFDGGSSSNSGNILGDATFLNGAVNIGAVNLGTFDIVSATTQILGNYTGSFLYSPGVVIVYGKGVNGSSILGIV